MRAFKNFDNLKIVAALHFQDRDSLYCRNLLNFADSLAAKVHFVYVCESWVRPELKMMIPDNYYYYSIAASVEEKEINHAELQLKELLTQLNQGRKMQVTGEVLLGNVTDAILNCAVTEQADIIICGIHHGKEYNILTKENTIVELFSRSQIPVLALPVSESCEFTQGRNKIMVGDDLGIGSVSAVNLAIKLGQMFNHEASVLHTHICSVFEKELEYTLEKFIEALSVTMTKDKEQISEKQMKTKFSEHAKEILKNHLKNNTDGIAYNTLIEFGQVFMKLKELIEDHHINLVVFGRHETLHLRPFALGKLPFQTMLTMNKPLLVVPSSY